MHEEDLAIGIDLGGTNTDFGIVDRTGKVLWRGGIKNKKITKKYLLT
jgi:predicted NBD/HSP70 family sugar kinase